MHPEEPHSSDGGEPQKEEEFRLGPAPENLKGEDDLIEDTDELMPSENIQQSFQWGSLKGMQEIWGKMLPLLSRSVKNARQFSPINVALEEFTVQLGKLAEADAATLSPSERECLPVLQCAFHLLCALRSEYWGVCMYGQMAARDNYFRSALTELAHAEKLMEGMHIPMELCELFPDIDEIFKRIVETRVRLSRHVFLSTPDR